MPPRIAREPIRRRSNVDHPEDGAVGRQSARVVAHRFAARLRVEFARALADELGATVRFTWLSPTGESFERAVRDGRCDLAPGVIVDPGPLADDPDLEGLALTRPCYEAGYVIVRRPDAEPLATLDDAGSTRIAVEGESIATFALRHRGHRVHVLFDHEAVLRAVADGRVNYGYVWGPVAAWLVRGREDVIVAPEFESPDRWSFALAVRAGEIALRRVLDAAIGSLEDEGRIARICLRYGLRACSVSGRGHARVDAGERCAGSLVGTRPGAPDPSRSLRWVGQARRSPARPARTGLPWTW